MDNDRTYSTSRVWREMMDEGFLCDQKQIERMMQLQALRARPRRRRLPKDEGDRQLVTVPSNILDRQFEAERPNQKWIADFTYIWTAEGWLYVSAVIDLFSRRVVGWSMSATMTAQLVADALLMAVWRRLRSCGTAIGASGHQAQRQEALSALQGGTAHRSSISPRRR